MEEDWTVCRLCLQSTEEPLKYVSGSLHNSLPYRSIYFSVTGKLLTDYKSLPTQICVACEENMISAYNFQQLCFETEDKLKDLELAAKAEPTDEDTFLADTKDTEADLIEPFDYEQEQMQEVKEEQEIKRILCKRCKIVFKGLDNFKRHKCRRKAIKEVAAVVVKPPTRRREIKEHKCMVCGKMIRGTHIMMHLDYHNGIKRYACEYCPKRFFWLASKTTHIHRDHLKKKSFKCPHCPREYWMSGSRNVHVRNRHLNQANFQCELCGKRFSLRHHLKKHKTIHIAGGPCHICGKVFKSLNRLNYHVKTHHKTPTQEQS